MSASQQSGTIATIGCALLSRWRLGGAERAPVGVDPAGGNCRKNSGFREDAWDVICVSFRGALFFRYNGQ